MTNMKQLGSTFVDEILAAGLGGLAFSWGDDGDIQGRENLTPEQSDALDAVIAAHDPEKRRPRILSKRAFFLALTDEEYETFAAIEAQQPARQRRAFAEALELNEGDEDFPQLLALMHAAYGEERTAKILDAAAL